MSQSIWIGLAQLAQVLRDAIADHLGVCPEDIQETVLVEHNADPESSFFYPIYVVDLPDRNLEVFLWDYHCNGTIEVYAKTTLMEGYCYPLSSCEACQELAAQGIVCKG